MSMIGLSITSVNRIFLGEVAPWTCGHSRKDVLYKKTLLCPTDRLKWAMMKSPMIKIIN